MEAPPFSTRNFQCYHGHQHPSERWRKRKSGAFMELGLEITSHLWNSIGQNLQGHILIVREAGTIVQLHDSRGKGNGFGEQLHHTALMCIC